MTENIDQQLQESLAFLDSSDSEDILKLLSGAGLDARVHLEGADLSNLDLSSIDLQGADLNHCLLTATILTDANLQGANLSHSVLIGTNLTGAILEDARIQDAILDQVVCEYCYLDSKRDVRVDFQHALDVLRSKQSRESEIYLSSVNKLRLEGKKANTIVSERRSISYSAGAISNIQGGTSGNLALNLKGGTSDNSNQDPQHIKTYYDSRNKILWLLMKGEPRPCITPRFLDEIEDLKHQVELDLQESHGGKYSYIVLGSDIEGVFSLGADLHLISQYIENSNRQGLLDYAKRIVDLVFSFSQGLFGSYSRIASVSLVQGDALGGGFELALATDILVAERGCKMGLPEVLFNLFPGMGAYSLLSRKIGPAAAEKMILSGNLLSAEKLYEMGVVDVLAEKGEGEMAIYRYFKKASRYSNSYKSIQKVKDICNQISYGELTDIATVWVDSAMNLTPRDLKMMKRLVRRQERAG